MPWPSPDHLLGKPPGSGRSVVGDSNKKSRKSTDPCLRRRSVVGISVCWVFLSLDYISPVMSFVMMLSSRFLGVLPSRLFFSSPKSRLVISFLLSCRVLSHARTLSSPFVKFTLSSSFVSRILSLDSLPFRRSSRFIVSR